MTDVCLILEGTYPFVSGGVSTWIHQLVSAMSELRFSILYISPFPNPRREYKFEVPSNVVEIQDLYLHEHSFARGRSWPWRRRRVFKSLEDLSSRLAREDWSAFAEALPYLRDKGLTLTDSDFFDSQEAWEQLAGLYGASGAQVSFLDYFWTWRSMHLSLFKTLRSPIPKARLYHTVSTGYAGVLAGVAKATEDRAMLLTEHGVYTHERLLEISQATWIYTPHAERFRVQKDLSFFKKLWLKFFRSMGCITYHHADRILTLYEGNKTKQILSGAPARKISIIPNGIDLDLYRGLYGDRPTGERPLTVAFIGRVVSIKDVKTFLYAAKLVLARMPKVEFFILGPTDEEPEYTQECRELAANLGIEAEARFLGKVDLKEHYPRIDVVALTSLSEAQPYVILEANAAGIPVVATDVGACREMLEGRLPEDRRIGPSGLLTGVANPEETAEAILRLLQDDRLRTAMSESGRNRTLRFYDLNDLISQYLNLYEQMMR